MNTAPAGEPAETIPAPFGSLRRRILTGGGAVMGGFGAGQVLRLISNLILTRLLAPEAFGLMAVAISINIWAVMLTDIGIGTSVIRSRNSGDPEFLRTAWTTGFLRNLVVWAVIALGAGGIFLMATYGAVPEGSIFANPVLPLLMLAIGIQLPIDGLGSVNASLAERRLAMGRVVGLEISRQIFTMMVTIGFAWLGFNVWALVIGAIAGAIFGASLSHVVYPGPAMKFRMVRKHFDEIFHFGKWLVIASFFGFILNRGDQLLFGWIMKSENFSLYAVAGIWVMAATSVIQTVVGRIFMPAFSEVLRDEPESLPALYRQVRLPMDLFVLATAFGAFFLAEPVFAFIYPDEYTGVGYYVRLLAPALLLLPYRLINIAALASGDSKGFTMVTVIGGIAMVILTPLAAHYLGERAAILVYACIALFSLPTIWRLGRKLMKLDLFIESRMIVALVILVSMLLITAKPV